MRLGRLHVHSFHGLGQIKSSAGSERFIAFTIPAAAIGKKDLAVTYYFTLIAVDNNCSSGIYTNAQQTPIRRHAFSHSVFPIHLGVAILEQQPTMYKISGLGRLNLFLAIA